MAALYLPSSWFSGKWRYLKGNDPIRGTQFSLKHDYAPKNPDPPDRIGLMDIDGLNIPSPRS